MFKRALAIAIIGAAALTSFGAYASDYRGPGTWDNGYRYAPPPAPRYVYPPRYMAPRYYPAYRWAPPYAYYRSGYHGYPRNWNGHGPNGWSDRDGRRDDHRDDRHDDGHGNWRR
jgi:hypothetical protein